MERKRYNKNISKVEKVVIEDSLRKVLEKHLEIFFAYIHGSFTKEGDFRDIDVAVYLKEVHPSPLQYELKMETELMEAVGKYQVDVRVLNSSPLSFKYNVLKEGVRLFVRNDEARTDFQEATLTNYFDFAPYRNMYLKETLGLGV